MLATWLVLAACAWCARSGPGPPQPAPAPSPQSYAFRFAHPLYNVSIPENSGPRTYAAQPPDEDPLGVWLPGIADPHSLRVRYRIRQGDKDRFFKAEERTVGDFCFLWIRTRAGNADVLNRERRETYRLEVRATLTYLADAEPTAAAAAPLEADVTVLLTVTDVNDLGPLFYPTEYETTVPEDAAVHSSLTRVFAEDADLGPAGELYYSLDGPSDQFVVHPTSGIVTLTRPLAHAERAEHYLTVVAQDRGSLSMRGSVLATALASHTARARVTLRVRPVNLHAPRIDVERQPELVENAPAGVIYAIVHVTDADEGVHGEIASLDIVDGDPDGHFRIRHGALPGEFEVRVHALLDRERTPQGYNLTLRATDAGHPPRTAYHTLAVRLADVNDNAPVFGREVYEASVSESAPPGTPLVRLKVTDADAGRNARVYIEIVGGNEGSEFRVNPDTGMLYTAVMLDAETRARYTLTVSAVDQGGAGVRRQSSAKVEVTVLDANDNDPVFERDESLVELDENRPSGALVARLTARDADSGENGYVSYSLANLRPVPFEVDHFTGVVRTTRLLDYETMRREYVLRVRASDWGTPYRRQAEMRLTVRLRDLNDNRPEFERVECEGHLPRTLSPGSELITLSAIDLDGGNVVSYRLVAGNDDGCFALDSSTGVLGLACDPNDVRDDTRIINVTATDGTHFADTIPLVLHLARAGAERRAAFECRDTGIARRLTDTLAAAERANAPLAPTLDEFALTPSRYGENLHAPEFIDFPVEVKVNESTALGTTLVRLRARDRDLGYNGLLAYVVSAGDPDSAFRIDPDTGDLTLIGYLDREREPDYYLNVTVYDLGSPPRAASRLLPVTVLDVNDNAPVFEKSLASFRVTENAHNGTAVFHANATDRDDGDFSRVEYSLSDDADGDFCVERESGVLRVCAPLDRERRALYELVIRATDGGGLYSEALVRVAVDDVNDNAPAFGLSTWAARVREDVPTGTPVAVVEARDPDLGAGGRVSYALSDAVEDNVFAVDAASGVLRTVAPLDFEQRQVYGVTVRAFDGGQPSLWSEAVVIVEVLDVDENTHAPQFTERVFVGSVRENSPPGTGVVTLNATDADLPGRDSRLAYYLLAGSGLGRFTVDDAGEVRTVAPLDRETTPHYWLTVCAQDHGLAPRHACVQLYVEVGDENDETPWPERPAYEVEIPEQCAGGTHVLRVRAHDGDAPTGPRAPLAYRIVAGNPDGLFSIDETTGEIRTTGRALDREVSAEHALEVRVSDGELACSARVAVRLADLNDHAPVFLEPLVELRLPVAAPPPDAADDADEADWDSDAEPDDADDAAAPWHSADHPQGTLIATVTAVDLDSGANGSVVYAVRARGAARDLFAVDAHSARLVALRTPPRALYRLHVRACDSGRPARCAVSRVAVRAAAAGGGAAPRLEPLPALHVAELDAPGLLLAVVRAHDPDGDALYYEIVDGDPRSEFHLGRHSGNLLLARRLLHERQAAYALNVSVTDGAHAASARLHVTVINDVNEGGVRFARERYAVDVEESARAGGALVALRAAGAGRLVYGVQAARAPASLRLFRLDSLSGVLELAAPLDRETAAEHELTVWVRDGAPRPAFAFARVTIRVHDADEHAPDWGPRRLLTARLPHRAPPGTLVAKVRATDLDTGENARIVYSLADGGAGGLFAVDPALGDVTLAAPLPAAPRDYTLQVRAANPAPSARAAALPLHVVLVEPDDAPPRFSRPLYLAEVYENEPAGAPLVALEARSPSTVWFELEPGPDAAAFRLNPAAGALSTARPLDYERRDLYELTVRATNMGGGASSARVLVHVLDRNEYPPRLERAEYAGRASEAAAPGTLVAEAGSAAPLVLATVDADSPANRRRAYEIVERDAAAAFAVDPVTGALSVARALDYELVSHYRFTVKVMDKGSPRLYSDSSATVTVAVEDVNDCPPRFERPHLNATLLLPTAAGVVVARLPAADADTPAAALAYRVIEGDERAAFAVDGAGVLRVADPRPLSAPARLRLRVRVSDARHSATARLDLALKEAPNSGLVFDRPEYFGSVVENSTKTTTVAVLDVLGAALDEHVLFEILNPNELFTIGRTSGAVRTTGRRFDRETRDAYELLVEARTEPAAAGAGADEARVARARLVVAVTDVNDNCPVFVGRPYVAGVAGGADAGAEVARVLALDADAGDNGRVRYEMKRGHGELFRVERHTGRVTLKQPLEARDQVYRLAVAAFDGGAPACGAEADVEVRVWGGGAAPWWERARLELAVREDAPPGQALAPPLLARSPLARALLYTLRPAEADDPASFGALRLFEIDFDTGVVRVAGALDYEAAAEHALVVRATDAVSGAHADAALVVRLEDANDCAPRFEREEYRARLSEAAPAGTLALRLRAHDNDTGVNAQLTYWLVEEEGVAAGTEHFAVDGPSGEVRVARGLDRERRARHHLVVGVRDAGTPPRSATAHVWLSLDDVNDSAPRVQRSLLAPRLWEVARRGHVVARVAAYDPDDDDALRLQYALADPDEARTRAFHVDPATGVITVGDGRAFAVLAAGGGGGPRRTVSLNVSVSDGAHAAFARVKIALAPDNTAPPQFTHVLYEARAPENRPPPLLLTTVKAHDPDRGEYGAVAYSIPSALLRDTFAVDPATGAVTTRVPLDRERRAEWTLPVTASDGGGLLRHTVVRVRVADVNDNAPVFFHREYRAAVRSDARHPFVTVCAADADEGDNAHVTYSIYEPETEPGAASGASRGLFVVDPQSGAVSLARNASQYDSQSVATWVRATDRGGLHATAPLTVYLLGAGERAPALRPTHDDLFLPESAPPGTLIADLGPLEDGVALRLADGLWPAGLFAVDALGRLTLAAALDRETRPLHRIGVLAAVAGAAEDAPATMAEVTLHVLDENEHAPAFHSQPYVVLLAENAPPQTSILQVVAEDADAGSNGEVRYSLVESAPQFALDAHSGWLTLRAPLDRERVPEHRLAVLASDGAPPAQRRSARTTVVVRLRDYDDCEPTFARDFYAADVPEDAVPGTVVVRLELRDADEEESAVEMYVTEGDPGCQFGVRAGGEVYVARPLDHERTVRYELRVLASDGKFSATTRLLLNVTDVNDNPPHCVRQRYEAVLPENAAVGAHVAAVEVVDADEPQHARPRFYLVGDGADRFAVDKDTGRVTVAAPLDRETRAAYALRVHAQDRERPDWECSSELEIVVDDVNDNAPHFTAARYGVTLPEDAELGTLVAKVHAVDADAGLNRFVRYELDESGVEGADSATFRVSPDGIVTLAAPLDRETRAAHRARIVARDGGDPPRSATVLLLLTVADVNDNPPRFEFAQYHVRVPELDRVGTEILRVAAVSADSGVNADVYYAIVGGDERDAFVIDRETGAISIARSLDYEKTREYSLSVQAIDGGEPPLSDLASVNVTVVDCNDNAPVFGQTAYEARVREDVPVGHRVVQTIADDADSGADGRVAYGIERGNEEGRFGIDPDTGYVSVAAPLDRETRDVYELIVRAEDRGVPALRSTAPLRVHVVDANDNPPLFAQKNYTAVVREDSPLGTAVLRLAVTDADAPPNGPPFTFDFQAGNEMGAFRLEADGRIETAARFNRRAKERHLLHVRVFDNGRPPLYSDAHIEVRVVERSQYPPVVSPLEVLIDSYRDEFPGGDVGRVHATDRDAYDTLAYSMTAPAATAALFALDPTDGTLRAQPRLDAGDYRLNVTVTDGKFRTTVVVRIAVVLVSDEMLAEAVTVRFREVAASDFVLAHRRGFVRAVCNAMSVDGADVLLLAVQPSGEGEEEDRRESGRTRRQVARDLDVVVAVRAAGGGMHAAETVRRRLNANLAELEQATRLVVEELVRGACGGCVHGACAERVEMRADRVRTVATEMYSLVTAPARLRAACSCLPGYTGVRCETPAAVVAEEQAEVAHLPGDAYLLYRVDPGIVNGRRLLADELLLSMRFRTLRTHGTLAYAAGRIDYNILEIEEGFVQFRQWLGSGEGVVRVDVPVADGAWHRLRLERRGASVRLAVDRHAVAGRAPPPAAVLDLRHDSLAVGARLERHAHALAPELPTRAFVGCLAELRLGGEPLPLAEGGGGRALLVRRPRVHTAAACPPLDPSTACASYPCMHGGTCRERAGEGEAFECDCHARFAGRRCEVDAEPCASQPCLHGGECAPAPDPPGFSCACAGGLRGARCELGRWCGSAAGAAAPVCAHGGDCEEGEWGPSCRCRGYYGPLCQFDVDECAGEPCLNGATCVNEPGSFRCLCPPDRTGMNCGNPLYSDAVVAGGAAGWDGALRWARAFGWPLWVGLGVAVLALLLLAATLIVLCRRRRAPPPAAHKEALLNSTAPAPQPAPADIKRTSKLSNLEAQRERHGAGGVGPGSPRRAPLNNMDTLRSYGSAGDELELMPPDYLRNLNVPAPAADKPWSEQMHLRTFTDNKIYNDLKGASAGKRSGAGAGAAFVDNRLRACGRAPSPRMVGGYHWDVSDWGAAALGAAISEVAGSERPDSSEPASEPRTSSRHRISDDTDHTRNSGRGARGADLSSGDDDRYGPAAAAAAAYALHPDAYLPRAALADTDSDSGPPRARPPRLRRADAASLITMLEERSSLLGDSDGVAARAGSCSSLSDNVCDIEESDAEREGEGEAPRPPPLTTDV